MRLFGRSGGLQQYRVSAVAAESSQYYATMTKHRSASLAKTADDTMVSGEIFMMVQNFPKKKKKGPCFGWPEGLVGSADCALLNTFIHGAERASPAVHSALYGGRHICIQGPHSAQPCRQMGSKHKSLHQELTQRVWNKFILCCG